MTQTAAPPTRTAFERLPFAEDSAIRRLGSESIILLGGGRALLMQIAHPLVARGVAEHSSFQRQRWQRLLRTLRPTFAIAFGTREQALAAAAGVNHLHESVAGAGYAATDPELLRWVLATLIDTTLESYQRFVQPLRPVEAEAYFEDMLCFGELLGVPRDAMPADLDAFHRYVEETVASLEVTDEARELARQIFSVTPGPWAVMWPLRELTAGLLPPRLRQQFGLGWGPARESALRGLGRASRAIVPLLPGPLRRPPWFLMPPRV
jgi:uncharacterized protein (DUF2236 family)